MSKCPCRRRPATAKGNVKVCKSQITRAQPFTRCSSGNTERREKQSGNREGMKEDKVQKNTETPAQTGHEHQADWINKSHFALTCHLSPLAVHNWTCVRDTRCGLLLHPPSSILHPPSSILHSPSSSFSSSSSSFSYSSFLVKNSPCLQLSNSSLASSASLFTGF